MARNGSARKAGAWVVACLLTLQAAPAAAQVTIPQEYGKTIKTAEVVGALGNDLFGEETNLYTGSTSFSVTDVSIPGNDALPVAVGRRYVVEERGNDKMPGLFADWDLDLPYLQGTYARGVGWKTYDQQRPNARCSVASVHLATPPDAFGSQGGIFAPEEFWHGNSLNVPGKGSMEMLVDIPTNPDRPTDGNAYYWTTSEQWFFSCLPDIYENGDLVPNSEGFLARAPDGTRYRFDWMVSRSEKVLKKAGAAPTGFASLDGDTTTMVVDDSTLLSREDVRILPTRIEDRFGNWVTYTYDPDNPWRLLSITSKDERTITFTYNPAGRIETVFDGTRTWTYSYANGTGVLTEVTLPDASKWLYDLATLGTAKVAAMQGPTWCEQKASADVQSTYSGTITHPSGAVGTFTFKPTLHGRAYVQKSCMGGQNGYAQHAWLFDTIALQTKTITGIGLSPMQWTYAYGPTNNSWWDGSDPKTCTSTKTVEVTGPGQWARHTFSNCWRYSDGKLLKVEQGSGPTDILRTETTNYLFEPAGQTYPALWGRNPFMRGDDTAQKPAPVIRREIVQQGKTFTWEVLANGAVYRFDTLARALEVKRHTSGSAVTRTDQTAYQDFKSLWVLGLPKSSTTNGLVESENVYDPATALPIATKAFGKLKLTATYHVNGTLATVSDGRDTPTFDTTISYSDWMRGIPERITYPDNHSKRAEVNPLGMIEWVQDEVGFRTCYQFDPMGRLTRVTYPSETQPQTCDESKWNALHRTFAPSATAELGLPVGHWKDTTHTGNGYQVTHYDALWRPVVVERYDNTDAATKTATLSQVVTRYAPQGGVAFQSYPGTGFTNYAAVTSGTRTTYDALGRPTLVEQDSEYGTPVRTKTDYLTGFATQVTAPGDQKTTTYFQTYDQPSTDQPRAIAHPEGAITDIPRDVFGKPQYITRRVANWSTALTRYYTYNAEQELCRTTEPETGVTLMGYDAAGNLAWSAAGLPAGTACGDLTAAQGRISTRTYDNRNRLTELQFGDDTGEQVWTYTPDSLPATVWTYNGPGRTIGVFNAYSYNSRRLLGGTGETLHQAGWYTWSLGYGYDRNGFLTVQNYPDTTSFTATVNALGQTTGITGTSGTYVSGASYHPNGALKQFTYGNGIVHTLTQNARGLPDRSKDVYAGSPAVLDDSYDYDFNGNVASISDGRPGGNMSRTMTYDGLDRLTSVTSPMFNGTISYTYDVLDNLQTLKAPANGPIAARDLRYCHEAGTNRLQFLRLGATTCSNGAAETVFEFDEQGNVRVKDGQGYTFTYDNRLREVVGKEKYRYDANGLRVTSESPTLGFIRSYYNKAGQLSFQADARTGKNLAHVYLAGSLVATREQPTAGGAPVLKFHHTDALGSPVAVTDASRGVTETTKYEPYGKVINRPLRDRHGFTGHIEDAQTGLNYMQQRYYDPETGVFVSADPATPTSKGQNFNRYWYANNNPYRFVDPDGRQACSAACLNMRARSDHVGGGLTGWSGSAKDAFIGRLNEISEMTPHGSESAAVMWFGSIALPLQKKFGVEIGANLAKFSDVDHRVVDIHLGQGSGEVGVVAFNRQYFEGAEWAGIIHTHPGSDTFSGLGADSRRYIYNAEGDVGMSIARKTNNFVIRADGVVQKFNYRAWLDSRSSEGKTLARDYVETY